VVARAQASRSSSAAAVDWRAICWVVEAAQRGRQQRTDVRARADVDTGTLSSQNGCNVRDAWPMSVVRAAHSHLMCVLDFKSGSASTSLAAAAQACCMFVIMLCQLIAALTYLRECQARDWQMRSNNRERKWALDVAFCRY
jgi:hypothetical protein